MTWRFAWTLVLLLAAGPAFALGLGQIQVRSQHGEPLLAEIPIVSSDPTELRQLQVGLASPATFARIGLQPPQGIVRDLQFSVALDASGRPVVRVTSSAPVDQSLLTFLIEADWGQGRLVREYSALLDAPDTIAAPAQPSIRAAEASAGDRIVRPAQNGPAIATAAAQEGVEPEATAAAGPDDLDDAPAPPSPEAASPSAAQVPRPAAGQLAPVQAGDALSVIAEGLAREQGVTTNQMMMALLRANPDAFIGGNINLLREGAVLRVPDRDHVLQQSVAEATAEVRRHVARWREMTAARPQPADVAAEVAAGPGEDAYDDGTAAGPRRAAAPAVDARLEIAPPSAADGQQAGTTSGIAAGGEGEMLRQELQETRETLAARDAEVEELKARLAELEQLQSKQQQLIELKDSELASVQQRLAETNQQPAPTLADANQPVDGSPPVAQGSGAWLWIGLGLVLILTATVLWARRRGSEGAAGERTPRSGRTSGSPAWHAGPMAAVGGALDRDNAGSADEAADAGPGGGTEVASAHVEEPAVTTTDVDSEALEAATPIAPSTPQPAIAMDRASGTEEEPSADSLADAPGQDLLTGAGERLELAKAYVELGDIETARDLLREVVASGEAAEAAEAGRLLVELA